MHQIETVSVDGSEMEVFVFEPPGQGPHPGLVLAQHIPVGHTGIENDEFTLRTAERFAADGYVEAVPFIFHCWPKQEEMMVKAKASRDEWTVKDVSAAFNLLAGRGDAASVDYVFHRYDGAGHAFQNFPTPDRYQERQSEDAWDKVLSFLARTLKPEQSNKS
jgi:carboxymethylenebutenolidase